MNRSGKTGFAAFAAMAALTVGGCVSTSPTSTADAAVQAMLKSSFHAQGQATLDRLTQDPLQKACSGETAPSAGVVAQIEKRELATIQPPQH